MDVAAIKPWPGWIPASLSLLAGVVLAQWLPSLPAGVSCIPWVALGLPLAVWVWRFRGGPLLSICACGMAWAMLHGAMAMAARLPTSVEGKDIEVTGRVLDLPAPGDDAVRFGFRIDAASLDGKVLPVHGDVRVAWYDRDAGVHACDVWRLRLRLKRPRAMLNPGGADSERSALVHRVVANGYVRESSQNRRVGQVAWCIDGLRARLAAGIAARVSVAHDAALLRAFALGDVRGLQPDDWSVARANGVSHLLAISGFHVGVAAAFGVWLAWVLYALRPGLALHVPRMQVEAAAALVTASFYGALAGMGLPTLRTLLMIAVVVAARCRRRALPAGHGLALAMVAMLAVDPLAVLSAGFWLSFVAVAFLVFCLHARWRGVGGFVRELVVTQAVMTVALLPLTLWFFGQASLVGALSNLVAVPAVSFVIVPLALAGVLALLMCTAVAVPAFWLAARAIHALWWLLARMAAWPGAQWYLPAVSTTALLLALLGAVWLLAPRGVPSRWLGLLLFLPMLWPSRLPPPRHAFEAWVLDVGQGLSVLVRTGHHTLLYDTGARYPSGFDVGAAVVVPSLRALGVQSLDMLIVSHADNDHAGGAAAVLDAFPAGRRLAGEPDRMPMPMAGCKAGQSWHWEGVSFRILSPEDAAYAGNNRSCVLLVDGSGDRLLLTGDITRLVEPTVTAAVPEGRPVVLVVPHHGSKTSSSEAFVRALHPELALVSAGRRNRFGHPYPAVVARYAAAHVPLLNTATSGAIDTVFPARGHVVIRREERRQGRRYWREQ